VGNVACMEEMRNWYKILVLKPEGKRPLGRSRNNGEDNIRMDILGKLGGRVWTGCMRLRIRISGGLL